MDHSQHDDLLTTLVGYFESSEQNTRASRKRCERDRDYADHKQLTDEELATLKQRKQPPVQNNYIRKKINFLRGYERKIRTDPKAYARTPQHDEDAKAATDALRYIADNSSFDVTRSDFWDNFIVEGTGGCEIVVNDKREVETHHIQWDRLFWDAHSRKADFSDARYTGIIIWDDADNIKHNFPGSDETVAASFTEANDDTFDDKPINWVDSQRKRLRIAQIYTDLLQS